MNARSLLLALLGLVPALATIGCGDASDPGSPTPGTGATPGSADASATNHADGGTGGPGTDGDASVTTPGSTDAGADTGATPSPKGALIAFASGTGAMLRAFTVDEATGALSPRASVAAPAGFNASFLAVNRASTNLYAIDESTPGRVAAFTIDPRTAVLTLLDTVSSGGNGPAHVSVDATGKWALVANYGDGKVSVLPVQAGGRLGDATDTQTVGANAHMAVTDPSSKFVFVPCKGADYVAQFVLDASAGKLVPNATPRLATAAGAGPRHIAFHPGGKLAYLINENDSTMTALSLDPVTGRLAAIETTSTLPPGFTGTNTGAEVWVHPSGNFVIGSNRGDDSLVVFAIDAATGKMTLKGHTKTGGKTPRSFGLDPAGGFLYAANQGSDSVVPFRVDVAQRTLAPLGGAVTVPGASFIGVVRLPLPSP
jgi:6-phosphogluconolactonase